MESVWSWSKDEGYRSYALASGNDDFVFRRDVLTDEVLAYLKTAACQSLGEEERLECLQLSVLFLLALQVAEAGHDI